MKWDESKHPRDEDGKFTDGNGGGTPAEKKRLKDRFGIDLEDDGVVEYRQNTSYTEILRGNQNQSGAISGAQSGALDPENPKDQPRTDEHARITYERIRRSTGDVAKIAQITGHTQEDIQRVKQHMFFNEYELDNGKHKFDPDFDQAQSWDRLQYGKALPHDFVMIEHEIIESELMKNGTSYDKAHKIANKTANYEQALEEYRYAMVNKKRN